MQTITTVLVLSYILFELIVIYPMFDRPDMHMKCNSNLLRNSPWC